jgi:Family of unknown function (DUF6065)
MLARFRKPPPRISFLCQPSDLGVIAEPRRAKTVLPDWFRKIAPVDLEHVGVGDNGITIKRCMPFLDALATGWIMPLAADVRLEIKDEGKTVDAGWEFDRTMVSNHSPHQVTDHPNTPRPPLKFHNYWAIRTPPGWSCLFVPPLNRPNGVFEVLAGIVDTDTYSAHINFPFFPIGADGVHTIEKGTPLVQVFPFRRADAGIGAEVRAETEDEARDRERVHRNTLAGAGWYRKFARGVRA